MHAEVVRWVKSHLPDSPGRVVEFGSRDANGNVRDLLTGEYVGVDLCDGPNVDVVADASVVELDPADVVLCLEVLEHTPIPHLIVENAYRTLKPGGRLILTCAGQGRTPHGQHGASRPVDGEHYRNIDAGHLRRWLTFYGFENVVVERGRNGGDIYVVADK